MTVEQGHPNNSVIFIINDNIDGSAAASAAAEWQERSFDSQILQPWTDSYFLGAVNVLKGNVAARVKRGENVTLIGTGAEGYLALAVAAELPVTAVTICTEFQLKQLKDDRNAKYGLRRVNELLEGGQLHVTPGRVINMTQFGKEATQTLPGASVLYIRNQSSRDPVHNGLTEPRLALIVPEIVGEQTFRRRVMPATRG